jgi:hypothetical protein
VEPATIDYGLDLSRTLQASLPGILKTIRQLLAQWQNEASNPSKQVVA